MQRVLLVTCILVALFFAAYKPAHAADGGAAACARCHAGR